MGQSPHYHTFLMPTARAQSIVHILKEMADINYLKPTQSFVAKCVDEIS
jgi:hypothetical protein